MSAVPYQASLFGHGTPRFDPRFSGLVRYELAHGAWVDHLSGWLAGHESVFTAVRDGTAWRSGSRPMYDRIVDVPRLLARFPDDAPDGPPHPVIPRLSTALSAHYGRTLNRVSAAWYRSGQDSVAWHGDRLGDRKHDAVVAIVSLGEPRRFLLKPASGGPSRAFHLGWGDLLVMGGTCQATWQHCVPKVAVAGPRISLMLREPSPADPQARVSQSSQRIVAASTANDATSAVNTYGMAPGATRVTRTAATDSQAQRKKGRRM